jgi:hypothetical protein
MNAAMALIRLQLGFVSRHALVAGRSGCSSAEYAPADGQEREGMIDDR